MTKIRWALLLLLLGSLTDCVCLALGVEFDCRNVYVRPDHEMDGLVAYHVTPTQMSPSGIEVDASGQTVDLDALDAQVVRFETLTSISVRRCGFVVKVSPDWKAETCIPGSGAEGRQIFPCESPGFRQGCQLDSCPCGCFGVVMWPNVIVVTPDWSTVVHELAHLVTGQDHSGPVFQIPGVM